MSPTKPKPKPSIHCAVYTRKSTEEGLEQEFNSLDAQREAGEAFVASQKAEGWTCLPHRYDDGGFSGGNVERPGLKSLMAGIEACGKQTATELRNRALLALLYRTGMRLGEALALEPKDLDLERGAVRVLRGKGGRARTVGIDPLGVSLVTPWLERRSRIDLPARAPLLCTRTGGTVTQAYVRRLLPQLAREAGIRKRVHAHGFRHTHASELRAEGIDVAIIRRQLGHSSLLTTITYLDHIAPTDLCERIIQRTPRLRTSPIAAHRSP